MIMVRPDVEVPAGKIDQSAKCDAPFKWSQSIEDYPTAPLLYFVDLEL